MLNTAADIVSINVPMTFRRRGGRKLIITPDGSVGNPTSHPIANNAVVAALARAFRWRKLINDGVYGSLEDIARKEKLCPPFVSRVMRLTLLSPEVIEAILEDRQPESLTLRKLSKAFPVEWVEQRRLWGGWGELIRYRAPTGAHPHPQSEKAGGDPG